MLVQYGADPNVGDDAGNTPLSILLDRSKKNTEAIALVLEAGAEINDRLANTFLGSGLLTKRKVKSDPYIRRMAEYLLKNAPEGKRKAIREKTGL